MWRQRMSALPSPLKSPLGWMVRSGVTVAIALALMTLARYANGFAELERLVGQFERRLWPTR